MIFNSSDNEAMASAVEGGHLEYFVSKGAQAWDWGMLHAAKAGNIEIVEYFISKGANTLSTILLISQLPKRFLETFFEIFICILNDIKLFC